MATELESLGIKYHLHPPKEIREEIKIKREADDFVVYEKQDEDLSVFKPLIDLKKFKEGQLAYESIPEIVEKSERKAIYDATRHYPFKKLQNKNGKFVVSEPTREVFVCTMLKRNLNTNDAAAMITKRLGISPQSVQVSGTKDRRAITFQEVSINCEFPALFNYAYSLSKNQELRNVKYGYSEEIEKANNEVIEEIKKHIEVTETETNDRIMLFNIRKGSSLNLGSLKGNFFRIKVDDVNEEVQTQGKEDVKFCEIEKTPEYFINYYGTQRFGMHFNNHIVGKMLLEKDYEQALSIILEGINSGRKISKFENYIKKTHEEGVPSKEILDKLNRISRMTYMHAYQSMEFNMAVNERIEKGRWLEGDKVYVDGEYRDPEPDTPLSSIYIPLEVHNDKFLKGGYRKMIEEIKEFSCEKTENGIILEFYLPKSAYATMALREILGCHNVVPYSRSG